MKTAIKYKSRGNNPDADNRINLRGAKTVYSSTKQLEKVHKDPAEFLAFVSDSEIYAFDKLILEKKRFFLLEPNPVTFYFSLAFDVLPQFEASRAKLLQVLNFTESQLEPSPSKAIAFSYVFKVTSVGAIFSFLCIEAFLNQQIPDHTTVDYKGKKLSKIQVQRWVNLMIKFG